MSGPVPAAVVQQADAQLYSCQGAFAAYPRPRGCGIPRSSWRLRPPAWGGCADHGELSRQGVLPWSGSQCTQEGRCAQGLATGEKVGLCPTPRPLRRTHIWLRPIYWSLRRTLFQRELTEGQLQWPLINGLSTNSIIFNLCLCFSGFYEGFTRKSIHRLSFLKLVDMRKTKISGKSRFYYPLFLKIQVCVYPLAFRLFEGRKNIYTNLRKED